MAGLTVGCGSASSTATTTTTHPVTLGSGCGRVPNPGPTSGATFGDVVQTLVVAGTPRSYRLAVPASYRAIRPTALIFDFHGSGSNAIQQSAYSQLPKVGADAGYLVVTPDAIGGNWDLAAPGTATADQQFVTALESELGARYCVDATRTYAAGISLGSEFATITACYPANHIAAVGLVSAEYLLRPCPGPVPVLAFHGTADPVVPYATGATGLSVPGIPVVGAVQNLEAWAELDHCRANPVISTPAPQITRSEWPGCTGTSSVILYSVLGGGHTWPGSPIVLPAAVLGPTTEAVSATHLMLAFFRAHPTRKA